MKNDYLTVMISTSLLFFLKIIFSHYKFKSKSKFSYSPLHSVVLFLILENNSSQAGLKLTVYLKLALNSQSFYFCFQNAGFIGMCHRSNCCYCCCYCFFSLFSLYFLLCSHGSFIIKRVPSSLFWYLGPRQDMKWWTGWCIVLSVDSRVLISFLRSDENWRWENIHSRNSWGTQEVIKPKELQIVYWHKDANLTSESIYVLELCQFQI